MAGKPGQDLLNNGKIQYFPSVHVDIFGAINIIFYDDRKTTSDSAGVFLARSTDGGDTWREFEISDHNYKPTPIGGLGQGYQGDNIDLTSTSSSLLPVWMDNSTGIYQIWTVPIDFTSINSLSEPLGHIQAAELYQNYPNPFSTSTKIPFRLVESGSARLKIYDVNGKEIACLLDEFVNSGYHSVRFDAMHLKGGIYYCCLAVDQGRTFKKLLLINH
jgi:hypothetical protein